MFYFTGDIVIKEEERNNKNRGKFRHFARQVSGSVYDVPEDNRVAFMYEKKCGRDFHVGQISFSLSDLNMKEPGYMFDSEYYPQISFIFVQRDCQGRGYGRLLLEESLKIMKTDQYKRPIRLQSAVDSVGFFEKCGFHTVGEPFDCNQSGSKLFKSLVNMELPSSFLK